MTSERDRSRLLRGGLAGLLAGAVAVGVGQFVASLINQVSSPVIAVGSQAVGLAPAPVKDFAISTFGSDDKIALLTGIYVLLGLYAVGVGLLGTLRLAYGIAGLAVFTVIGLVAAATVHGSTPLWLIPTLAAAAAAAAVLVIMLRHNEAEEAQAAEAADTQRRWFLRTGVVAVGVAVVGGLAGRVLAERGAVSAALAKLRLPRAAKLAPALPAGTSLDIPGLTPFVTPNPSFYLVDIELVLPQVDPTGWQLRIHGMVEREVVINFDDLLRRPLTDAWITLCCVSNPVAGPYIGNAKWLGAPLASLIREARPLAGADQILSTSVDGYTCGTPVETVLDGRNALLAVGMNGKPLPVSHGFPVRMVVPGLYGYVSATKWVTDIKLTKFSQETAYWAQRGWSQQAVIKTESRIDVPSGYKTLTAGRTPVAGVAWAQHRGIDAVHVRVDRGPWNEARLAAVPGIDTWRQWVWEWDATPGTHLIEARATDDTGYTQTSLSEPPEPNGASGYPQVQVTVH
jgi:DMSO/TMAO reductase YedYZ molybdopterin-dependent catalytic subunit